MKTMSIPRVRRLILVIAAFASLSVSGAYAAFTGTDLFVPGVAHAAGAGGSEFYSTIWVTNTSNAPASIHVSLLLLGNANPTPVTKTDVVPGNGTRRYDDVVGTLFGITGGGALHITSDQELMVSCRTYTQPPGFALKDTNGLSFSAVRSDLAIPAGQNTQLNGVTTASADAFRYNFGLIETTGQPVTIKATVQDENGAQLSSPQIYSLGGYGVTQINDFAGFSPALSTTNGVVRIDVVGGTGKVIAYGAQNAGTGTNAGSNDGTGFEMRFAGIPTATTGVSSINGQAGAVTIQAGANAKVDTSGGTITVSGVQGPKGDPGPQGPAGTAGSGGPAARYVLSDATPVPSGTDVRMNFPTQVYDTDNTITTGVNWQFKAPVKGIYHFGAAVQVNTANDYPQTPAAYLGLIYGSQNITLAFNSYQPYENFAVPVVGSTELLLNANDVVYFVVQTNFNGTTSPDATANWATVSFVRAIN